MTTGVMHEMMPSSSIIEIVTWNDWGTLDHSAFLKMTGIFIKAYKAGQTDVKINPAEEDVFFFYRLHPATTLGAWDTLPLPSDVQYLKDNVCVVSFLASEASITLNSEGNVHYISAVAGVRKTCIPWTLGDQSLTAQRNGQLFVDKKGPSISRQLNRYNGNVIVL